MPKASKKRVKSVSFQDRKRKQIRFATSSTYMPLWVAIVGMVGCLILGGGVFGLWIADPPMGYPEHGWTSYLVATGGCGLGIALWFGQPSEIAVAVGDAGVAVEYSRQTQRINWFDVRAIRIAGSQLVVDGVQLSIKFMLGANREASALLLKEAAERVPEVLDVRADLVKTLPQPSGNQGQVEHIEDDQVAGARCAASKMIIQLEDDARICPRCGQVYHKEHVPNRCVSCKHELGNNIITA
jgi:hypothetical protein